MENRNLVILQLRRPVAGEPLERAYRASCARYERLTARGPLRYYRQDLLSEAKRAYRTLRHPYQDLIRSWGLPAPEKTKPQSVVARNAARQKVLDSLKTPVRSEVKIDPKPILTGKPLSLKARRVSEWQEKQRWDSNRITEQDLSCADAKLSERRKALIEDDFCREVIYRLEGDLLRYDSRRELLQIAKDHNIHLFRANMLIAQIVEAVRQHKLYNPVPAETREKQTGRKSRSWLRRFVLIAAIVSAVVADVLLIRWLGR
jgi:hypothetical protein